MTKWTSEKEKFLIDNYHKIPREKIIDKLGLSKTTIYEKAKKLGLVNTQLCSKEIITYSPGLESRIELESRKRTLELKMIKDGFHKGQKLKLKIIKQGKGNKPQVSYFRGKVTHKTNMLITLQKNTSKYQESFKYVDFLIGEAIRMEA